MFQRRCFLTGTAINASLLLAGDWASTSSGCLLTVLCVGLKFKLGL